MKNVNKFTIIIPLITMILLSSCSDTKYTSIKDIMNDYFSFLKDNNSEKAIKLSCNSYLGTGNQAKSSIIDSESNFVANYSFSSYNFIAEENIEDNGINYKREYFDIANSSGKKRHFLDIMKAPNLSLCIDGLDFSQNNTDYLTDKESDERLVSVFNKIYNHPTGTKYIREKDIDNIINSINNGLKTKFEYSDIKNRLDKMNKDGVIKISYTTAFSEKDKITMLDDIITNIVIPEEGIIKAKNFKETKYYKQLSEYIKSINSLGLNTTIGIAGDDAKIDKYKHLYLYLINANTNLNNDNEIIFDSENLMAYSRTILFLENTIYENASNLKVKEGTKNEIAKIINTYRNSTLIKDGTTKEKVEMKLFGRNKDDVFVINIFSIIPDGDTGKYKLILPKTTSMNLEIKDDPEDGIYVTKYPQYSYSEIDK